MSHSDFKIPLAKNCKTKNDQKVAVAILEIITLCFYSYVASSFEFASRGML